MIKITGIPIIMSTSRTLATEVVENSKDSIIFKLRQEYTPRASPTVAINRLLLSGLPLVACTLHSFPCEIL